MSFDPLVCLVTILLSSAVSFVGGVVIGIAFKAAEIRDERE